MVLEASSSPKASNTATVALATLAPSTLNGTQETLTSKSTTVRTS